MTKNRYEKANEHTPQLFVQAYNEKDVFCIETASAVETVKDKEKDHLLDGPDMYHVPVKPYVEQCGEEELTEKQKTLKAGEWLCPGCGAVNSGKFCAECGAPFDGGDIR